VDYRELGNTGIQVSTLCLGTMTWGRQNTEAEAFEQLDHATGEAGINFIDTAELYPVPPEAETFTETESIIGNWLTRRGRRDDLVLASKIAGPGPDHIRGGHTRYTRQTLTDAIDGSLKRLQTDYIDLYQLHWPERNTNFFGELGYPEGEDPADCTAFEETLRALGDAVAAGKIRYVGLSNETPWGVMRYLALAEREGLPRVVSVQNPYNLLNRTYEVGLAEVSIREKAGLLAYSPLAFGVLSGKYIDGARPEGARISLFPRFDRYMNEQARMATEEYIALAHAHDLDPAQMALAYVNSRPFLTSNIIGATTMEQLRTNIASHELTLSGEVLEGIEAIHTRYPNPSP